MPRTRNKERKIGKHNKDEMMSALLMIENVFKHDTRHLETSRSSFCHAITPARESPSILSEEQHSYYQNVTPSKLPDEECKDEIHQSKEHIITPLMFRPLLKAGPRSNKRKGRKLGKSMIAMDTPEKERIAEERTAALNRKGQHKRKVLQDCGNKILPLTSKIRKTPYKKNMKKIVIPDDDSETSAGGDIILESETDLESVEKDNQGYEIIDEDFTDLQRKPMINEYVLVLLQCKKRAVYYVAKILEIETDDEYCVSYLKLKDRQNKTFMFPLEPDMANVKVSDIKMILPPPCVRYKTCD
ncbi:unnamed protein product [Pieris macdunnoughi]|uniref:Uncharacterized protein n=1 Tax=Pieris macdunnoughi TaxID=345717 RepID=A0A821RNG9_9NEOP|nr:unnamed protein product [Pieris macdunnoughi]